MALITSDRASKIVREINPDITPEVLSSLLESSRAFGLQNGVSTPSYRPYAVAAFSLITNPPNSGLKKADTAEWFDYSSRIESLLGLQAAFDSELTDIPLSWSVEKLRADSCSVCGSKSQANTKTYNLSAFTAY